nr:hypothetical protein [Mesorhizobium neociceri]
MTASSATRDEGAAAVGAGHIGIDGEMAAERRRTSSLALASREPVKHNGVAILREILFDQLERRWNAPHNVDRENLATGFCASLKHAAEHMFWTFSDL